MRLISFFVAAIAVAIAYPQISVAGDLDAGYSLQAANQAEQAADFFCGYANAQPNNGTYTPEALAMCGRLLDELSDILTERAEKKCYWGKSGDPSCMEAEAGRLNARFGAGSFRYVHNLLSLVYTGAQYQTVLSRFSNSKYADEADFYILLRGLVGHPDVVLPKIRSYLSRHKSGEWNRKGLLLWARVNEDIWYIHRKWSWVLYNYTIAPDELIIKAEPYRQEAQKAYKALMKSASTFEGKVAAAEYAKLDAGQEDPVLYSIVEDSHPGTLRLSWGMSVAEAPVTPTMMYSNQPGAAPAGPAEVHVPQNAAPAPVPPPEGASQPEKKSKDVPQRWGR